MAAPGYEGQTGKNADRKGYRQNRRRNSHPFAALLRSAESIPAFLFASLVPRWKADNAAATHWCRNHLVFSFKWTGPGKTAKPDAVCPVTTLARTDRQAGGPGRLATARWTVAAACVRSGPARRAPPPPSPP